MEINTLTIGPLQTNTYLISDNHNNCLIIDPADEADFISSTIIELKLKPLAILLTHGHYDHCLACLELQLNFNIPIYLHHNDLSLYQKAHTSAKHFSGIHIPSLPPINYYLTDNQKLSFEQFQVKAIHTPGHTPGSTCFLINNNLFTGDTLFKNSIGSTEHKYSSKNDLRNSLTKMKSIIKDNLILVYPGHEDYGFIPALLEIF